MASHGRSDAPKRLPASSSAVDVSAAGAAAINRSAGVATSRSGAAATSMSGATTRRADARACAGDSRGRVDGRAGGNATRRGGGAKPCARSTTSAVIDAMRIWLPKPLALPQPVLSLRTPEASVSWSRWFARPGARDRTHSLRDRSVWSSRLLLVFGSSPGGRAARAGARTLGLASTARANRPRRRSRAALARARGADRPAHRPRDPKRIELCGRSCRSSDGTMRRRPTWFSASRRS
mmetsp:Transcript_14544/g.45005  ORF Transcript_14544/g.45005 Transcript_14544/m.45005 type:complete len:237 (+) Transcript_14544:503-1213(+)